MAFFKKSITAAMLVAVIAVANACSVHVTVGEIFTAVSSVPIETAAEKYIAASGPQGQSQVVLVNSVFAKPEADIFCA